MRRRILCSKYIKGPGRAGRPARAPYNASARSPFRCARGSPRRWMPRCWWGPACSARTHRCGQGGWVTETGAAGYRRSGHPQPGMPRFCTAPDGPAVGLAVKPRVACARSNVALCSNRWMEGRQRPQQDSFRSGVTVTAAALVWALQCRPAWLVMCSEGHLLKAMAPISSRSHSSDGTVVHSGGLGPAACCRQGRSRDSADTGGR